MDTIFPKLTNNIIRVVIALVLVLIIMVPICDSYNEGNSHPHRESNDGVPMKMITSNYNSSVSLEDLDSTTPEYVVVSPVLTIMSAPVNEDDEQEYTQMNSIDIECPPQLFKWARYNQGYNTEVLDTLLMYSRSLDLSFDGESLTIVGTLIDELYGEISEPISWTFSVSTNWMCVPDSEGEWAISKAPFIFADYYSTSVHSPITYPIDVHCDDLSKVWVNFFAFDGGNSTEIEYPHQYGWNDSITYYDPLVINSLGMGDTMNTPYQGTFNISFNESEDIFNTGNIEISNDTYTRGEYYIESVLYPRYYDLGAVGLELDADTDNSSDIVGTLISIIPLFVILAIICSVGYMFIESNRIE